MNLNQPVTYIVLCALGLVALAMGLLSLLGSGKSKIVFGRVSGGMLLLVSLGCLVFGFYQLYINMLVEAGGFFLVAIALFLMGWFFFIWGVDDEGDLRC